MQRDKGSAEKRSTSQSCSQSFHVSYFRICAWLQHREIVCTDSTFSEHSSHRSSSVTDRTGETHGQGLDWSWKVNLCPWQSKVWFPRGQVLQHHKNNSFMRDSQTQEKKLLARWKKIEKEIEITPVLRGVILNSLRANGWSPVTLPVLRQIQQNFTCCSKLYPLAEVTWLCLSFRQKKVCMLFRDQTLMKSDELMV